MRGPSKSDTVRVVRPGSHEDGLPFGRLCETLGQQIINANANHTMHRIDLYREVDVDGRRFFVRVKFTVPFLSVTPEPAHA